MCGIVDLDWVIDSWKEMLKLYHDLIANDIIDALYVWKLMKEGEFYVFSCAEPLSPFEQPKTNTSTGCNLPAEVINVDTLVCHNKIWI